MDWRRLRSLDPLPSGAEGRFGDARPCDDPGRGRRPDPEHERRLRLRRRAGLLFFASVFLVGAIAAVFGRGGLLEVLRLRGQLDVAEVRLEQQRARVEALREEVRRLERDPATRERIAREQLGFAAPGEITFLVPDEAPDAEADASGVGGASPEHPSGRGRGPGA